MLGRIPIVIADNLMFRDKLCPAPMSTRASEMQLARWLEVVFRSGEIFDVCAPLRGEIISYFDDPTLYFLAWMQRRGILDGSEFINELNTN